MGVTYTTREAAAQIGVHELTLRQWELEGKIPRAPRNLQGSRNYTENDIRNLLAYKNTGRYESSPVTAAKHFEIIAFVNQKGGVAKTTTSVNLAAAFARLGKKVLLADVDPQGHAGLGLGVDIHGDIPTMYDVLIDGKNINEIIVPAYVDGLFLAPSNIQLSTADLVTSGMLHRNILLKKALRQLPEDFDLVLVDCPPTIGILTYNALIACTKIYVPVEMDFYALEGMSQLIDTINLVNEVRDEPVNVSRVIVTKYEQQTKITQAALSNIKEFFGEKVCKTYIRKNTTVREAPSEGKAILDYAPASSGASDYWKLAEELFVAEAMGSEGAEEEDLAESVEAAAAAGGATPTVSEQEAPVRTPAVDTEFLDAADTEPLPRQAPKGPAISVEPVDAPVGAGAESKDAHNEAE